MTKPGFNFVFSVWLGYLFFVVYGSLVPLEFKPIPIDQAWAAFQQIPFLVLGVESRADWIANGVLYVPVGFLTAHLLTEKLSSIWRAPLFFIGTIFSFTLAFSVEFTQLYFPPRTVSLNDLLAECIGVLIGLALAARYSNWFQILVHALFSNPRQLVLRLVEAYLVTYIAFSLFPYDLLLSGSELIQKIQGNNWGWLLAGDVQGKFLLTLKLLSEIALTLPFGLFLGYRAVAKPVSSRQAIWWGLLLGGFIEIAQLFTASGVSQGFSVFTRVVGIWGGLVLWNHRANWSPDRLASLVQRYASLLGAAYFLVLLQVNGWFSHAWNGPVYAIAQLDTAHFLPFYYHYFTTEAKALYSLASVFLMYLPIGLLTWSKRGSPSLAFIYALLAASLVETGKLFLQGLHPDPTNILVAALASWAAVYLLRELSNASSAKIGEYPAGHPLNPTSADKHISPSHDEYKGVTSLHTIMFASLALVGYWAATFPAQPVLLSLFLLIFATTIWYRPVLLVAIIPATLPILDLATWSGRFFFDEFDLLVLIGLVIGYIRVGPITRKNQRVDTLFVFASSLLVISFTIGAIRGLTPWQMPDANAFTNYYSPSNALRIAKGALWAFLLYGLFGRITFAGNNVPRLFAFGMMTGVAGTVLVIIWERLAFPGLYNFGDVYRVTGPFSQMHVGGADIETYLVIGAPFLVMLFFAKVSVWVRIACVSLLLAATYSVMVTFSRVGYAGFALAFTFAVVAVTMNKSADRPSTLFKRVAAPLILLLAIFGIATPIFYSQFAQERMAVVGADLNTRQNHWEDALRMRDSDWATALLGMGIGRYPDTHFWRSDEAKAAPYWLGLEPANTFLRLGAGNPTYVEQFISPQVGNDYVVDLNVRSTKPNSQLTLSICEKWLLTSARCNAEVVNFNGNGTWQPVEVRIPSGDLGQGSWFASRPVKFSLYNTSPSAIVELDNIRMSGIAGNSLLANGDFSQKFDRWFFSVDNDLPWHIWSLPIQVLFDQGWLGVSAFGVFVLLGLWKAGQQTWRGNTGAGIFFAAGTGFVVIGTLDSLIDSPRLLLLFLLVMWLCWNSARLSPQARGQKPNHEIMGKT